MKKSIFWVLCLLIYQVSMAQENRNSFDFIVCVDAEIAKSLIRPVIVAKQGTDISKRIDVSYHPGNLSLNSEGYNEIFSEQEITLFLQFDYYQYSSEGKQEVYSYEIEIGRNWFEQTFVILKIYNLDKMEYRKRLEPLSEEKNYTFDLETSQGQMIRINR